MNLTEQEAHCIARLLQGAWYTNIEYGLAGSLQACQYCKYQCYKENPEHKHTMLSAIKKRLTEETGVDIRYGHGSQLLGSDFPYFMFLKNSNDEIKEYFRSRFSHI